MAVLDLPLREEQQLLLDSVQRFLTDKDRPLWRDLSDELGLAGVCVPEIAGGFGGGPAEMALVIAELGPALAGADWLSHAAATLLLARITPDHALLPELASGTRRIAMVCAASALSMPIIESDGTVRGAATLVAGAAEADLFLIADTDALLLIAADSGKVEQRHRVMHDGSVTADLNFMLKAGDSEPIATGAGAQSLTDYGNDLILAGRCAEAVGLMKRMIADSIEYLGQRRQFGTEIGSFQALRHRVADMQLAMMKASALAEAAIVAIELERPDRAQAMSAACVEVAEAVRIVGEGAVQIAGIEGWAGKPRIVPGPIAIEKGVGVLDRRDTLQSHRFHQAVL